MKNNRKNKKLKFIRDKNNLRLGITKFYYSSKISDNLELTKQYLEHLVLMAKKDLLSKFKLNLPKTELSTGVDGEDFLKNIITFRVALYLK